MRLTRSGAELLTAVAASTMTPGFPIQECLDPRKEYELARADRQSFAKTLSAKYGIAESHDVHVVGGEELISALETWTEDLVCICACGSSEWQVTVVLSEEGTRLIGASAVPNKMKGSPNLDGVNVAEGVDDSAERVLERAGWTPGRSVDISGTLSSIAESKLTATEPVREWLRSYDGLWSSVGNRSVWIDARAALGMHPSDDRTATTTANALAKGLLPVGWIVDAPLFLGPRAETVLGVDKQLVVAEGELKEVIASRVRVDES